MLEEHRHWCPWITKSLSPSTSPITDGSPILPVKKTAKTPAASSSSTPMTSTTQASSVVQVDNITSSSTEPKSSATSSTNTQQSRARSLLANKQQMPGWKVVLITIFPALGRNVTSPMVSIIYGLEIILIIKFVSS